MASARLKAFGWVMGVQMVAVLIVDDEPLVASALQRAFKRLGLTSRLLADPSLTEAVIREERPALVISDLWMPGRSGLEVLASVRRLFPGIRRCLLSGSLFDLRRQDLAQVEPCVLLGKPWTLNELRELVEAELRVA